MTRLEFNGRLRRSLAGLPAEDVDKVLEYYNEMINDRMEDGMREEDAVADLGPLEDIVDAILAETPLPKLVRERIKPKRRFRGWEIVLLVLGFPVWFPVLVALGAVGIAVFSTFWAVVIAFYAVTLALGVSGIVCILDACLNAVTPTNVIFSIGGALVCIGLAIGFFFLSTAIAKGVIALGKLITLGVKRCISGKERKEDE